MRILKKDTPERFILLFFHQKKLVRLFILKEVKPSPDGKMIKLLTFDNLFPPLPHLKLLVELRRLSRFATKMTLVHGSWAILSIEKISYSKSSSSQNLKLSIIDTSLYAGTIVPGLSDQKDWVDFGDWSVIFTLQWASVYIFLSPQTIHYFTFYRVTIICGATFDKKSMVF